ncbi:L-ectoine synthase [Pseudobythopirellula maris]|uniref:L-ectoine synthase n=1 Tax=Pseudobythopirellula maris TaxID=2527991 RepID=A0A5C5ZL35_9BACT|nr:ectoine synthase [Pseudobythopirellula maris]TWT87143.1 L-ectoine synthase [Pseudobythopirellula maris]
MIVRSLEELKDAGRVVSDTGWTSRRLLLADDGMGFSVHDTEIDEGAKLELHYQNHLESVYVIEGTGHITDLATGEKHPLQPGTVYALDQNDKHILVAETKLRTVCVFNPPLVGPESHDENGAYPLLTAETAAS